MDSVLQNFHRCAQTLAGLMLAALAGCATVASQSAPTGNAVLKQEVIDTERAFARTMAMRYHVAFTGFLAEEAVFFSGRVLRGKQAVAEAWKKFYEAPAAPFSWEPNEADVQVLDSGTLALSSGPVRNARGEVFATFTSIWRREGPGVWRIIFDKGNDVCQKCATADKAP